MVIVDMTAAAYSNDPSDRAETRTVRGSNLVRDKKGSDLLWGPHYFLFN
jgi:hypothetical protein